MLDQWTIVVHDVQGHVQLWIQHVDWEQPTIVTSALGYHHLHTVHDVTCVEQYHTCIGWAPPCPRPTTPRVLYLHCNDPKVVGTRSPVPHDGTLLSAATQTRRARCCDAQRIRLQPTPACRRPCRPFCARSRCCHISQAATATDTCPCHRHAEATAKAIAVVVQVTMSGSWTIHPVLRAATKGMVSSYAYEMNTDALWTCVLSTLTHRRKPTQSARSMQCMP
jgi:hypothetical protein